MAKKAKAKPKSGPGGENGAAEDNSLSCELGHMAKLFALYLMKDVDDEGTKIVRLSAVGFSVPEIAALLDKTENAVRVQISKARAKKGE